MRKDVVSHQVLVRFQEPYNFSGGHVSRLAEFTNYDGLVVEENPIDAINVDITSYCFDLERVREDLNKFVENISSVLGVRCTLVPNNTTYSSKDIVCLIANEPIREVSYIIAIL